MTSKNLTRWLLILVVLAVALGLRLRAARLLPIDYDEDDYLATAEHYARAIAAGDLAGITEYTYVQEHPLLAKLVYSLVLLPLPPASPPIAELDPSAAPARSLPQPHFRVARTTAAALGALAVTLLAALNPLAGFFLGINSWAVKYTSQVMLESFASVVSVLTVLFYLRWRPTGERPQGRARWLVLSAVMLGMTAASKYVYAFAGVAILLDGLLDLAPGGEEPGRRRIPLLPLVGWGVLAILVFVAANPRLWPNPLERLTQSLLYWPAYSQGQAVAGAGYPAWQPLVWLAGPVPWHPGVFIFILDLYLSLLAIAGFARAWRKQRALALWLLVGLLFLIVWKTKWPQYIVPLLAPLSVAAAYGFQQHIAEPVGRWWTGRAARAAVRQPPARGGLRGLGRAAPWLLPGLVVLALIMIFPLVYQLGMALTDFNAVSIRDGINGGLWREVWQGITGQVEPRQVDPFNTYQRPTRVSYTGPGLLLALIGGGITDLLVFNMLWMVLVLALQTAVGVGAALLLSQPRVRFRPFWLGVFFLPWAIPEYVGALIWLRIFYPQYGWLALAAAPQGVSAPALDSGPEAFLGCVLVAGLWYGFPMLLLAAMAGLKLIPADVYDAAAMDGAAGWGLFRNVTWPLMWPLLAPAMIIRAIFAFNQFYLFYAMNANYPTSTFSTISFLVFNYNGQYFLSAALNVFVVLVLIGLLAWFNRWSRAGEGVTYA